MLSLDPVRATGDRKLQIEVRTAGAGGPSWSAGSDVGGLHELSLDSELRGMPP